MIHYILVFALLTAPKTTDPVAKELMLVNKALKDYEDVGCTGREFTSAAIHLGNEIKTFAKILAKASKKQITDNKEDIDKFLTEYKLAEQDKASCVLLSDKPYFPHSNI